MTDRNDAAPPTVLRLAQYITDGAVDDPLADELTAWLTVSSRFRAFADLHRDKIRKKLRTARDPDARLDVRVEMSVACRMLADRRVDLEYEAWGSTKGGPDFSITFRGERSFGLEVTRLRRSPTTAAVGATLVAKLRQLPPSVPNALLLAIAASDARAIDVGAAIRMLGERAAARNDAFFIGRGLDGSRGFRHRLTRLGTVLTWCEQAAGDAQAAAWPNPSARIPLPARATGAILVSLMHDLRPSSGS